MAKSATPTVPPVKQCVDPEHDQFGATAVWSERLGRYGVMNPGISNPNALGGHWADDADVAGWAELPAPQVQPATPPADPTPAS